VSRNREAYGTQGFSFGIDEQHLGKGIMCLRDGMLPRRWGRVV
jgi:hypothetical protein